MDLSDPAVTAILERAADVSAQEAAALDAALRAELRARPDLLEAVREFSIATFFGETGPGCSTTGRPIHAGASS
jgi:hypothetical protein